MERAVTYITLDVQKIDSGVLIKTKRGDSARRLVVSLTNRGRPYIPGEGVTAVFYERKPDGNPCFNDCDIDGCTVSYDFTGQTTNVVGLAACEIRLYDAGNHLLTSPRFEMLVDATEYQEGDVPDSSPEYTALTEMVAKGTELIRDLTDVQAGLEPIRDAAIQAAQEAEASANRAEAAAAEAGEAEARARGALAATTTQADIAKQAREDAQAAAEAAAASEQSTALMRDEVRSNLQDAETAAQAAQDAAEAIKKPLAQLTLATAREGDGDNGVILAPEGAAQAPVLTLYGLNGDEPVIVRNAAPAERDDDLPTLGQVRELIGQGGNTGGGGGSIIVDEEGYLTTASGGFDIDEDGYIIL